MKKAWKQPRLEVLSVSMTMKFFPPIDCGGGDDGHDKDDNHCWYS